MSIKYFNQKKEGFEHITLEEFNLLERLRKQKIKDEEEWTKNQRAKDFMDCLGNGAGSEQASYERDTDE